MSDPDMGSWSYAYNALGNLTQQTDARGRATNLQYDLLNRLLGKTYSNTTGGNCAAIAASTPQVSFSYDQGTNGKGHRTAMADGSGSTSWQYDGRGRMAVETVAINGVGAYTTKWAYDSADQQTAITYPSGETVSTSYNTQGLAISLDSTMWVSYASQVKYDEAGRTLEWTLGNGVKTSRAHYPWSAQGGRLQSISSVTGTTPAFTRQNLVYGYDANGNVTSVQDTVAGESLAYTYDVLDQLTAASGAYSESYTYNATSGNLASKGGQTLTYATTGHPHAASAMGSSTYTYDANGNMLTRKVGGVTYTLSYDAEGRLVSISGTGLSASYTYNGEGERVKAVVTTGGVTKTTAYLGDYFEVSLGTATPPQTPVVQNCSVSHCAFLPFVTTPMALVPAGQAWTSYYYLGGQRIAIRVQSRQVGVVDGTYYPLSDHLGGTTVTLDKDANRMAELRYKAWGQTRYTYWTTPTQRRFTGQLEAEAGLYFYNARWYDPALGRFAQADTVIPDPGNPLAWDRYAYVYNNSQKYTDPTGKEICDEEGNCFDQGTRTNKRGLAMGKPKNSMPQYFSVSSPSYNPKLLEKNLQETFAFVDFMGRIAFEPYDWYRVGVDCLNQQCNGWDFLGLLPFLPAGLSRYGDDVIALTKFYKPTKSNFRRNLTILTGQTMDAIKGLEAHHVLPVQFEKRFKELGIVNIHDPRFGSWVAKSTHRGWSYEYN